MSDGHDCAAQFVSDAVVAAAETETIPVRGHCGTCGRELVECYDYTETIDRETRTTLSRSYPEPVYQLR